MSASQLTELFSCIAAEQLRPCLDTRRESLDEGTSGMCQSEQADARSLANSDVGPASLLHTQVVQAIARSSSSPAPPTQQMACHAVRMAGACPRLVSVNAILAMREVIAANALKATCALRESAILTYSPLVNLVLTILCMLNNLYGHAKS